MIRETGETRRPALDFQIMKDKVLSRCSLARHIRLRKTDDDDGNDDDDGDVDEDMVLT